MIVVMWVLIIVSLIVFAAVEYARLRWVARGAENAPIRPVRPFSDIRVPQGLFLDPHHSWARLTNVGELKVGIDELVTQAIGGVDRIELPPVGERVVAGRPMATAWKGGRSLTVVAPVTGTVVSHNASLERNARVVGDDPYGSGWIASVWPEDLGESLGNLRVGAKSVAWLRSETRRFCDFMAAKAAPENIGAVLADGAHPVIGAAQSLDDEAWSKFETEFILKDFN